MNKTYFYLMKASNTATQGIDRDTYECILFLISLYYTWDCIVSCAALSWTELKWTELKLSDLNPTELRNWR